MKRQILALSLLAMPTLAVADTCAIFPGFEGKLLAFTLGFRMHNPALVELRDYLYKKNEMFGDRISIHKFDAIQIHDGSPLNFGGVLQVDMDATTLAGLIKNHHYFLCLSKSTPEEDVLFKQGIIEDFHAVVKRTEEAQKKIEEADFTLSRDFEKLEKNGEEYSTHMGYFMSDGQQPEILDAINTVADEGEKMDLYIKSMIEDIWILGPKSDVKLNISVEVKYTTGDASNSKEWEKKVYRIGSRKLDEKESVQVLLDVANGNTDNVVKLMSFNGAQFKLDNKVVVEMQNRVKELNASKIVKSVQVKTKVALSYWGAAFPLGEITESRSGKEFQKMNRSIIDFRTFEKLGD